MKSLIIIITVFMGILPIAAQDIEVDGIKYSLLGKGNLKVIGGPASGKLVIPDSVTFRGKTLYPISIGKGAFANSAITKVQLPTSIIEIDDNAFRGSKVESINFPCRLNRIGKYAFEDTQLDSIFLPASLAYHPHYAATGLDQYSFKNCKKLRVVEFDKEGKPSKDTRISFDEKENQSIRVYYGAFDHCDNIEKIICNGKSPHFDLGWDQNYSSRTFPTMVLQFATLYCPAQYVEQESKWFDTVKPIQETIAAYEESKQHNLLRNQIGNKALSIIKKLWDENTIGWVKESSWSQHTGTVEKTIFICGQEGTFGVGGDPKIKKASVEDNLLTVSTTKKDVMKFDFINRMSIFDTKNLYIIDYFSGKDINDIEVITDSTDNAMAFKISYKDYGNYGNRFDNSKCFIIIDGKFYSFDKKLNSDIISLFDSVPLI